MALFLDVFGKLIMENTLFYNITINGDHNK